MNDTPAPLSADSLRAIFEPLEKSGFPTDSVMKAIDAYTAAALQSERQRIADSLEAEANTYTTVLQGYEGKIEAVPVEAVRAVLIPPTPGASDVPQ